MQIITEKNFIGTDPNHPDAEFFHVLKYEDGNLSHIPKKFFRNNHDEDIFNHPFGEFVIGRDSIFGPDSVVKYDSGRQKLIVGRHVRAGLRVKLILNGQHNVDTMAMSLFSGQIKTPPTPQYGDLQIKSDVWIGDEAMILGGAQIENGCIIGARSVVLPNFQTEPFGIYSGNPARLIRFRFSEKVVEALLQLSWWEKDFDWVRQHSDLFNLNLVEQEDLFLECVTQLINEN